ncbi:MAG: hypothetical protein AUJ92_09300 [Armatimonadetes bacterium CG2_30_59_28]|nr:glycosyltransferase family 2 protein [Armatimonadota bacterium]OIO94756.1 MAG: hypothetical protein AUJ92_09300 [Armatimonadetes bacterium CG2_30_59_28]PIU67404.1 MAG: glycosyltransferase family 2 protein [Armatimonadetes bacterium CG07_land_8_20_14_0_80_59_28]PIY44076.1 MAG: glycosyltransferase family 2 protein [Armatimonadetes bacterium CG_4_10_14_3_um_filter_59_10]
MSSQDATLKNADTQPDLTIIIVNWNAEQHLRRCLPSIEAAMAPEAASAGSPIRVEVFLVDNASSDGSIAFVQTAHPWVKVIRNGTNAGFAKANNTGLRLSSGRYAMLLNPDTIVKQGALRKLIGFMDENPTVGAVGPKLLNPDGSLQLSCRSYPGIGAGLFRNTPLGRLFPNNRWTRQYLMADCDHNEARSADWLSGACLMVRREMIDDVGLLDEDYFMYCEDVDWCYRMERRGWRKVYFPEAEVIHVIGASSDQKIPAMLAAHHISMSLFYFKHYFFGWRMLLAPLMLGGIAARGASALLRYIFFRART